MKDLGVRVCVYVCVCVCFFINTMMIHLRPQLGGSQRVLVLGR